MTQPERYVKPRELAELMGVSRRTIDRWLAQGMPSETWGMRRTRRFLPSQAIAWARDHKMEYDNPLDRRHNVVEPTNRRRHL